MFDYLSMVTGSILPVPQLQVNLTQPTISEIAIIGESKFYEALSLFNIDKDKIISNLDKKIPNEKERNEAKSRLSSMSNFDILIEMVNSSPSLKLDIEMILLLVLPQYQIVIEDQYIQATSATGEVPLLITQTNFDILKDAILEIFCINSITGRSEGDEFNPANDAARAIAEKIMKGRQKVRELNGEANSNSSVLGTYVSRLGIGSNCLNITNANKLTVFQLKDQMKVFGLWSQHKQGIQAMLAGAKDVEIVDWLKGF